MSAIVGQRRWELLAAVGLALAAGYAVAGGAAAVAIAAVIGAVAVAVAIDRPIVAALAMAVAAPEFAGSEARISRSGLADQRNPDRGGREYSSSSSVRRLDRDRGPGSAPGQCST